MDKTMVIYVEFPCDVVCQKLLKLCLTKVRLNLKKNIAENVRSWDFCTDQRLSWNATNRPNVGKLEIRQQSYVI